MGSRLVTRVRTRTTTSCFFFFNDTATTEIYTLSLHDALPISEELLRAAVGPGGVVVADAGGPRGVENRVAARAQRLDAARSEEHTSELQSRQYLVCRLLLEKKNMKGSQTV